MMAKSTNPRQTATRPLYFEWKEGPLARPRVDPRKETEEAQRLHERRVEEYRLRRLRLQQEQLQHEVAERRATAVRREMFANLRFAIKPLACLFVIAFVWFVVLDRGHNIRLGLGFLWNHAARMLVG